MSKQDSIGRFNCPYCGRDVPITATEHYWYHVPSNPNSVYATKGQLGTYCTGSGEPVSMSVLRVLRESAHEQG